MNSTKSKPENNSLMTVLPVRSGRYIILDTETTGVNAERNNVIELACIEINKGKVTGSQFHCYLKPRYKIDIKAQAKHKLHPTFYEDYFSDVYQSDKTSLEHFLKFIGNSLVFAHNATFDINFINNELKYWGLPVIPRGRFRCTMRIFKHIFGPIDHRLQKYCSLAKCCEFFNIKSGRENFHSAIFDSFMTARLVCQLYEFIEAHNANPGSCISTTGVHLALIGGDKFFSAKNIGVANTDVKRRVVEVDINHDDVGEPCREGGENVNPNEMKDGDEEPEYIEPDDIMNIIEEHGDFIENYMNDGVEEIDKGVVHVTEVVEANGAGDENEIDINMVDYIKEEEKVNLEETEDTKRNLKDKYKLMMRNFYEESNKASESNTNYLGLTNEELAGLEDIIKNNI
jgi:DNA polymerase III epsilon subunit-like protein